MPLQSQEVLASPALSYSEAQVERRLKRKVTAQQSVDHSFYWEAAKKRKKRRGIETKSQRTPK